MGRAARQSVGREQLEAPADRDGAMVKHKSNAGRYLFGLVAVGLATVGWGVGPGGWLERDQAAAIEGVPVRRGDLRISEVAHGNLESKNSIRLVNELEGQTTIIFLAEEGSTVEQGQLVCELDVSGLRDRRVSQEITVRDAEAQFTKAKEQYDIQEIENQTEIAAAQLALELAQLDLEKYTTEDGEWTNEKAQAEEEIKIAQEELKQAEATLEWSERLAQQGFLQRTELERDQLAKERAAINLEQATRDRDLKIAYGSKRRLKELQAAVETAKRGTTKAEKQATARLADYEAARESARDKLELERGKLAKLDDQIGKGRITAPERGMLVYSRTKRRGMGGGEVPEQGGQAHERQEIATIPREGGMTAQASVHETKLQKIKMGQRCQVTIDAIPGQHFDGRLAFIGAVADSGSWMTNPNQRLYRTDVTLTETSPQMRPGMSCNIEVLIDHIEDVLYVPRSAVFLDGGRTICFVNGGGRVASRQVEVGQDNNKQVEIRSGLEQGEVVLLSPPASWEPTPVSRQPALEGSATEPDALPADSAAMAEEAQREQPGNGGEPVEGGARGADGAGRRAGREGGRRGPGEGRWGGGGDGERPSPEELEERMRNMTPEMRERFEAMRRQREEGGGE